MMDSFATRKIRNSATTPSFPLDSSEPPRIRSADGRIEELPDPKGPLDPTPPIPIDASLATGEESKEEIIFTPLTPTPGNQPYPPEVAPGISPSNHLEKSSSPPPSRTWGAWVTEFFTGSSGSKVTPGTPAQKKTLEKTLPSSSTQNQQMTLTPELIAGASSQQLCTWSTQLKEEIAQLANSSPSEEEVNTKRELLKAFAQRIPEVSTYGLTLEELKGTFYFSPTFPSYQESDSYNTVKESLKTAKENLCFSFDHLRKLDPTNVSLGDNFDSFYAASRESSMKKVLISVKDSVSSLSPPPTKRGEILTYLNKELNTIETSRIERILNQPKEIERILDANPPVSTSPSTVLQKIRKSKDPALVILQNDSGSSTANSSAERKSSWSIVPAWKWFWRTPQEKERYRGGIKSVRAYVHQLYGPYARERFDRSFALRYRKGSPLTVGAFQRFLMKEEALIPTQDSYARAVVPLDLQGPELNSEKKEKSVEKTPGLLSKLDELSSNLLDRAKAEFDFTYYDQRNSFSDPVTREEKQKSISSEDNALLFAHFYKHYLQRSVIIDREMPPEISGAKGILGFFSTRWNALMSSLSHGNNQRAHRDLENQLIPWIIQQVPLASQAKTKEFIEKTFQEKLSSEGRITLETLEGLLALAALSGENENTWINYFYYQWYRPIMNAAATIAGTAAAGALVTNDSSLSRGAAKAAALGAALWALGEDQPGMKLSLSLATWWAAKNPQQVESGLSAITSNVTEAAKQAAIFYAGLHFPPLWVLHLL